MEDHLIYVTAAYIFTAFVLFLFSLNSYFSNKKIKRQLNKVDQDLSEKIE